MTLIQKVIRLLSVNHNGLTTKELYEKLPEYSPTGIRGVISRYLRTTETPAFERKEAGIFVLIEVIKAEKTEEGVSLSYRASYETPENGSIDFFYKDVFVDNEMMEEGVYEKKRTFTDEQDFLNAKKNLQAVLAHADAKTILNKLKTESFDMILTDPPYRVISGGTGGKNAPRGMLSKNDGKIFDNNDIQFDEYIPECYRVLKPDRQAYFFTNFLNLQPLMEAVQRAGFKIHNLLVWLKNNATPNRWYMKNCEYVLFCYKGKAKAISNCGSKTVHQFDNIKGQKLHETEKPVELLKMYIENSTEEGDWILDPFAGSGSTMAASLLLNRKVFTCEIDKKYLAVIKNRAISIIKNGTDERALSV